MTISVPCTITCYGLFLVNSQWQQKSRLHVSTLCAKLGYLAVTLSFTVIKQRVVLSSNLTFSENQNKLISQNVSMWDLFVFSVNLFPLYIAPTAHLHIQTKRWYVSSCDRQVVEGRGH